MLQPVNKDYLYQKDSTKLFTMFDNYVYLYHTDTLIAIPTYPEQIQDSMTSTYQSSTPLSRSAPIYSFVSAGPRTFNVSLTFHRDMMNAINLKNSNLNIPEADLSKIDYCDTMINQLRAVVMPKYASGEKMVNPPIVAVRFGHDIFCKGVVSGAVTTSYSGPILRNNRYAIVSVDFPITEIDPYDATQVMSMGGNRGFSTDLERRIWKTGGR